MQFPKIVLILSLVMSANLSAIPRSDVEKLKNAQRILNYPRTIALAGVSVVLGIPLGAAIGFGLGIRLVRLATGGQTCQDGMAGVPFAIIGAPIGGLAGYIGTRILGEYLFIRHARQVIEQFLASNEPLTDLLPADVCAILEKYRQYSHMNIGKAAKLIRELETAAGNAFLLEE